MTMRAVLERVRFYASLVPEVVADCARDARHTLSRADK